MWRLLMDIISSYGVKEFGIWAVLNFYKEQRKLAGKDEK
jgi:hypothetical protein